MESLALYIHWPFCRAKCPYCDFNSHVRESVDQEPWKNGLLAELAFIASHLPNRCITSIFFGGGTPSLMPPATAAALIEAAARHWAMDAACEITLEANPTSAESAAFSGFAAAGVNRVSLGVQALNEADLRFLGRKHDVSEALAGVKLAARYFPRYSFDLIYARPGQGIASWKEELARALDHADGHLSLYQLTIEEQTAFHAAVERGEFALPRDAMAARLYEVTQEVMEIAGMPAYEISNHARPGHESRHNLAYWRGQEYAGIGPGAHGRLVIPPECAGGAARERGENWVATATLKSPERWLQSVQTKGHGMEIWQQLGVRERQEEALMMRLRLREGFARDEFPLLDAAAVAKLQTQRLLEDHEARLRPTAKGRLLLNWLTAELLAA
ncbi:MAG: coproporphyrinogen III oxidase [Alphaproteobacteria bacterium]|nr:coproporphyrinogen III oxidase [Alphaproteobacteria bacterium]